MSERFPQPASEEPSEETPSRRQFLQKAGTFLSGAAVAGSMLEKAGNAVKNGTSPKRSALGAEGDHEELFSKEELVEELSELKKQFPNEWRMEAEKRADAGIELLLEALNGERGDERAKTATGYGAVGGAGLAVIKEIAQFDEKIFDEPLKKAGQHIVDAINRAGVLTALGAGTGFGGGKLVEHLNSKNIDERDKAFQAVAEKLSSATLRRLGAASEGRTVEDEFANLIDFIEGEVAAYEVFMENKAKLKSSIAKWGAGSFFTARTMWDKSEAFRALLEKEK